jgi:hypothetical protein
MDINRTIRRKQVTHKGEALMNHRNKGVSTFSPGVSIRKLLKDVRLLCERLVADFNVHREVCAHVEGRVDVDELDAALPFDLLAQRAVLKG